SDPTLPVGLPVNRAADNWRPLLAIADLAGGVWPDRARAAALALSGLRAADDEPVNVMLLADARQVSEDRGDPEHVSSEDIIDALKSVPERPWGDWNRGRGLSAAQLASRLKEFGAGPLGLRTRNTKIDKGNKVGKRWHREDFVDAWG